VFICFDKSLRRQSGVVGLKVFNHFLEKSKMALKPLHDRLVVRQIEAETTTAGGIVIPDKATEKPTQGEVLAVGPGQVTDNGQVRPLDVKPGDRVLYNQYAGNKVKHEGEELLILKESDVLAIVETTQKQEKAA